MQSNYKKVKQILWTILFANFAVALLKIIVGTVIKSASMTADGFHSISDGTSNIVGLIGIGIAAKPKDKEHPYGHNKFEVISGLFIGAMLLLLGGKIVLDALASFKNPVVPEITTASLIALAITLIINIFVSIGVLATLIGVKLGLPPIIDPIASLVVAGFIIHASYEIFQSTIDVLVDKAIVDDEEVVKVLKEFDEIKTYHDIRSRGSENNIHLDMHIMVDPSMTVEDAHRLSHDIEDRIREITNENSQVIVHIEP